MQSQFFNQGIRPNRASSQCAKYTEFHSTEQRLRPPETQSELEYLVGDRSFFNHSLVHATLLPLQIVVVMILRETTMPVQQSLEPEAKEILRKVSAKGFKKGLVPRSVNRNALNASHAWHSSLSIAIAPVPPHSTALICDSLR